MKKKELFYFVFLVSVLLTSVYFTDTAKSLTASDQLELKAGSYVDGKVYYSNSTVTDEPIYRVHIGVEKIINATDVGLNVVLFNYTVYVAEGEENDFLEEFTKLEMDALVFEHNRTTILPAARLVLANDTFSVEISLIEGETLEYWSDINNTKVTFNNGTSYKVGEMEPGDFGYTEIAMWLLVYALYNALLFMYQMRTLFAISPTANIDDRINYYDMSAFQDALAPVVDKPQITDANGKTHDTIHVKYENTAIVSFDTTTVDAYYETKTGLLIRSVETVGSEIYEFVPSDVVIKKGILGLIPFPFVDVALGFMAIGLLTLYLKKRKH